MDRQGNTYTFIYASVLVVVVAALLAFVSQTLKPIQQKNIEVAKKIDILKSVNITSTPKDAVEKYEKYIGNNSFILNYDGQKVDGDAFTVSLEKEVKKPAKDRLYPIYICTIDGTKKFIIPVRGKGLWGPIWGYISLNDDKKTILLIFNSLVDSKIFEYIDSLSELSTERYQLFVIMGKYQAWEFYL